MQRLAFLLLCFLASVLGRRSLPDSSKSNSKTVLPKPTMYMHGWHTPYGWGLPMDEQDFVKQEEKKVKEVKRRKSFDGGFSGLVLWIRSLFILFFHSRILFSF
jgi:hypothetical protein